jgi:hypothetical protein
MKHAFFICARGKMHSMRERPIDYMCRARQASQVFLGLVCVICVESENSHAGYTKLTLYNLRHAWTNRIVVQEETPANHSSTRCAQHFYFVPFSFLHITNHQKLQSYSTAQYFAHWRGTKLALSSPLGGTGSSTQRRGVFVCVAPCICLRLCCSSNCSPMLSA